LYVLSFVFLKNLLHFIEYDTGRLVDSEQADYTS
jgi:hypothetical protein